MNVIYLGRDNAIEWELLVDGKTVTLSSVTRVVVWLPPSASEDGTPVVFDTNSDSDITLTASSTRVRIEGGERLLNTGSYPSYLTVYDAANPDGLAWGVNPIQVVARPSDS